MPTRRRISDGTAIRWTTWLLQHPEATWEELRDHFPGWTDKVYQHFIAAFQGSM